MGAVPIPATMNTKRSTIWKIPTDDLVNIVKTSSSKSEILRRIGSFPKGNNTVTLLKRLIQDNIDYSHLRFGRDWSKGLRISRKKIPIEQLLVENSSYGRSHLKRRLIEDKIIPYVCSECSFDPDIHVWNGKKLVLILDHINGIFNDNRKENLRFLCPNCNSQTDTFAGKRKAYSEVGKR